MSIDQFISGSGLVIGARANWTELPLTTDVLFVDVSDLPHLRRSNPAWRDEVIAPVDVVDQSGTLRFADDRSMDYVIDWRMPFGAQAAPERLRATARVLKPGGAAIFPHRCGLSSSLGGYVAQIETALSFSEDRLEVGMFVRRGAFNIAVLRRSSDLRCRQALVLYRDTIYALNKGRLRHVTSLPAFERLRSAGLPSFTIDEAEWTLFLEGPPLHMGGVLEFLAAKEVSYEQNA